MEGGGTTKRVDVPLGPLNMMGCSVPNNGTELGPSKGKAAWPNSGVSSWFTEAEI